MNFAESNFVAKSCDSSIAIERTGADILVDCSSKGVNLLADPDPKVTAEYVSNVFTPTWEFLMAALKPRFLMASATMSESSLCRVAGTVFLTA